MGQEAGMKKRYKHWSDEETLFLKDNCEKITDKELGGIFWRTATSIGRKRRELGLMRRRRSPLVNSNLSETEKAYLAGVLDADGSIFLSFYQYPRGEGKGVHSAISLALGFNTANRGYADEICEIIGGGLTKRKEENYWEVCVSSQNNILCLLRQLLPYIRFKRKQAEIMIEYCKSRLENRYKRGVNAPRTDYELSLVEKMRELNTTEVYKRKWK